MSTFLGMKGTGQFATDEDPQSWREGIIHEYPNGAAPLTAILSMMDDRKLTSYEFNWWTEVFPEEFAAITGIFTDTGLSAAYTTATKAVGDMLFVKITEANSLKFRPGLVVHLVKKDDTTKQAYGKTISVVQNGANSYVAVSLRQAIGASGAEGVDYIRIIGTSNAQGATRPEAQSGTPVKYSNYTQIFRDPLKLTRTALQTKLRTEDQRNRARREAFERHARRIEQGMIFGIPSEVTGDNGQPETTTAGIKYFIETYAADNIFNYVTDDATANKWAAPVNWNGDAWLTGGANWLNAALEVLFRFGDTEKLALCGSGVIAAINGLAESLGTVQIKPREMAYGLSIYEWITGHGTVYLKTHPLMTQDPTTRNMMIALEPRQLKWAYLNDTDFYGDTDFDMKKAKETGLDGIEEEFLTEAGLEFYLPQHHGIFNGFGGTNTN